MYEESAEGMADQNVRRRDGRCLEQGVQLLYQLRSDTRRRRRVAPPQPGTVIGTGARESSNLGFERCPVERGSSDARFEDHCGTALPRLHEMPAAAIYVY